VGAPADNALTRRGAALYSPQSMTRKDTVFAILGAFFLTNAIIAEMIGGKIIYFGDETTRVGPLGPFPMSVGVMLWPVVFLSTDLINEYFGKRGVRRLTFLAVGMIGYAFVAVALTRLPPAADFSSIDDASYDRVFRQSQWIIVGSICAFLLSQLLDVMIFHYFRRRTGKAMIWLRSTGSTIFSQLIDSVVVLYVGLKLPGDLGMPSSVNWSWEQFLRTAVTNYTVKLTIAILATPVIYIGHHAVEAYLGKTEAEAIAENAARESGDL